MYFLCHGVLGFEGSILDCHRCDSKDTVHPECWPIKVPDGDPYFPKVNATTGLPFCLHFIRSLPGQLTLGMDDGTCSVAVISNFYDKNANTAFCVAFSFASVYTRSEKGKRQKSCFTSLQRNIL